MKRPEFASVNNVDSALNWDAAKSFETLKQEIQRLVFEPVTRLAKELSREDDLEIPKEVVCPGCCQVLMCHPFKYAILKREISWFYTCKTCKLPFIALPQYLATV